MQSTVPLFVTLNRLDGDMVKVKVSHSLIAVGVGVRVPLYLGHS